MGLASFNRMRIQQETLRNEMKSKEGIDLSKKTREELRLIAKDIGLTGYSSLNKEDLIKAILVFNKAKVKEEQSESKEEAE